MKKSIIWIVLMLVGVVAHAQQDMDLATEYFKQGEYVKAKEIFQKVIKDKNAARVVHNNYLNCLLKLKDFDEAEKFLKKQIKNNEENISYKADQAALFEKTGKIEEAQKAMNEVIALAAKNENSVYEMVDYFYKNDKSDLVIDLLKKPEKKPSQIQSMP